MTFTSQLLRHYRVGGRRGAMLDLSAEAQADDKDLGPS